MDPRIDGLSGDQQRALQQIRDLTNGGDDDVALSVLQSVAWDVQRAADVIFSAGPIPASPSPSPSPSTSASTSYPPHSTAENSDNGNRTTMETFELDDSEQGQGYPYDPDARAEHHPLHQRQRHTHNNTWHVLPRPLLSLLAVPFHVLASILRFVLAVLRIPVPQLSLFSLYTSSSLLGGRWTRGTRGGRGSRPSQSRGADAWVRELEEETGAISISRYTKQSTYGNGGSTTTAVEAGGAGGEAGPSTLTSRTNNAAALNALFAEALAARSINSRNDIDGGVDDVRGTISGGGRINGVGMSDGSRGVSGGRKVLPDFFVGAYEDALRVCESEARVGCVVLVSEEHDDTREFKRSTLTDPVLVKTLHDNAVLVWGADVREGEGWGAAEKLQATTFPFVAFVALQPKRHVTSSSASGSGSRGNGAGSVMTVLSRHQGPSTPSTSSTSTTSHSGLSSTPGPTSAQALLEHLERQVLPRVLPYLARVTAARTQHALERARAERERERDRVLRAEQDRAFREAERRDRERAAGAERERREREERERRERERERAVREREECEERERREREEERRAWRAWIAGRVGEGKGSGEGGGGEGGVKLAMRMPDSKRVIEVFGPEATLTTLYAAVDAKLPIDQEGAAGVPVGADEGRSVEEVLDDFLATRSVVNGGDGGDGGAVAWWGFKVVNAYPREEIPWVARRRLADVPCLTQRGGGQVVVEMVAKTTKTKGGSGRSSRNRDRAGDRAGTGTNEEGDGDDGDDGYNTESDDE